MREKDRRCGQPAVNNSKVKIRLAPLPTRNLSIGNSLNLEECLNRSVQMDRPSSRMSDLSNFSGHSMISVARSNYEHQSDELRRSRNRNVIEALRMKDIRRKRPNYLNENADNRSVDLAFNAKRKRGAYDNDDDESELDCLFNKRGKTKFARGLHENLQIPSRNRFVSSQYKNNEIASSYFSINSNQQPRVRSMTAGSSSINSNQLTGRNQLGDHQQHFNFSPCRVFQQRPLQDPNESMKLFKVPTITISNSSSKENTNVSNSLSNASISPISRKGDRSAESSSSALFKPLDGSPATEQNRHEASGGLEFMDTCTASPNRNEPQSSAQKERNEAAPSTTKDKNENYTIPEYFHSIDEHIRDENKAKSRLGAFLKAIYNVTSPFISRAASTTEAVDKGANSAALSATMTTSALSTIPSAFPAIASTATSSTGSKTMNDSILKLPPLDDPSSKLNSTSTPLKVTFNLPSSTTEKTAVAKADLSSVFKFGQMSSDQRTTKADAATTSTASTSSLFKFGANDTTDKSKQDPNKTTSIFTLPTTSTVLSTALSNNKPNFAASNQQPENNAPSSFKKDTSKTPFAISLPTTSSFSLNPAANSSAASSSVFAFGQTATAAEKPAATAQQDANKSSSFVFKFGSEQSTTATATNPNSSATNSSNFKPAPVFNFGQPSATATNNNLNSSKLSSSSFSFGESQTDANNSLLKPVTSSAAFTFGSDLNKQQQNSTLLPTANKPPAAPSSSLFSFGNLDNSGTATMFKAPSTTFKFGNTDPQQSNKPAAPSIPNFSFGAGDKAKETNPLLSSSSNPLLNNSLAVNGAGFKYNLNPSLNSNLASNLTSNLTANNMNNKNQISSLAFNFGASSNLSTTSFGGSQQSQGSSAPFKFDASSAQTKPSFNFGGGGGSTTVSNPPAASFSFGASASNLPAFGASASNPPAFGSTANDSTFTTPTFNSTVNSNLFNMGRK